VNLAFQSLNPGIVLHDTWHIRYLSEVLCYLDGMESKFLIISIPPRNLKSTLISVIWPAWLMGKDPTKRIIAASYSQKLSNKLSLDCRFMITQKWYRDIFPELVVSKDQNEKHKFTTTSHGFRLATSTNGTITGEGGDILILDDPHNPKEIFSSKLRYRTIRWFEQIFSSRLNNRKTGKIVIVMQRLHSEDLAGYLIEKGGYDSINIPIISDEKAIIECGEIKKTFAKGELLDENRFNHAIIETLKSQLGDVSFSAQYLGKPLAMSGNIIKKELIIVESSLPVFPEQIFQSWDSASCNNSTSDYSVCSTWYIKEEKYYLVDIFREKTSFIELKNAAKACYLKYKPDIILVEGKSSGLALFDELVDQNYPVHKINPKDDKISKLIQVLSFFENKKVILCLNHYSMNDLQNELLQFPQSKNDDQVDSITQFLLWYKNRTVIKVRNVLA